MASAEFRSSKKTPRCLFVYAGLFNEKQKNFQEKVKKSLR